MTLRALIPSQQSQLDEAERWPLYRCLVVVVCPRCRRGNGVGEVFARSDAVGEVHHKAADDPPDHVALCPVGPVALCSIYDEGFVTAAKQWPDPERAPLATHRGVVLDAPTTPASLPFCCDRGHRSTAVTRRLAAAARTVLADPRGKPKTLRADEMPDPHATTG